MLTVLVQLTKNVPIKANKQQKKSSVKTFLIQFHSELKRWYNDGVSASPRSADWLFAEQAGR